MMEIMSPAELAPFLWRMVESSDQGKITWGKMRDSAYHFKTDRIGEFFYAVKSKDSDDVAPFLFQVYRRKADEPTTFEFVGGWESEEFSPINDPLEALYGSAKRQAMGYTQIAADMYASLAALDGGPRLPPTVEKEADPRSDPWARAQSDEPPF